jgi:pimeloyl-ACP methyl ester carboxylesterase
MNKRQALTRIFAAAMICGTSVLAATTPADPVAEAIGMESADALPATEFFQVSAAEVSGKPGTMIRSEDFAGYDLPSQVRATRILYRSRSQLDHPTVASAVIIVPTSTPPPGGWPILIWAHGTTGVAPACAPSRSKHLGYYTDTLVKEGLTRNFAVVAVDYSGLGAGGQHEYLWKEANANDTVFAASAARSAEPHLAASWVAIGHSQGGQTVWGVAEKMAALHDDSYRGSVALAPAVDTQPLIDHVGTTVGETFYPVYVAFGIHAVYPDFDIHSMLLPTGLDAYERLTTRGCWSLANALFQPVKPGAVINPQWIKNPDVKEMLKSNQVGIKKIAGPLFIASGDIDDAVPPGVIEPRVKALCATGATVRYKKYPGDHGTMMKSSFSDQMSWIVERFQGRPATTSCP